MSVSPRFIPMARTTISGTKAGSVVMLTVKDGKFTLAQ